MDTPYYTASQPCCLKSHQYVQLPCRRVSQIFYRHPSSFNKGFGLKAITCSHNLSSGEPSSKPFKVWLCCDDETKKLSTSVADKAKQVPLFVYRALLLVGVGLGTTAPAIAGAPSRAPEALVQKAVGKATQDKAENSVMQNDTPENISVENTQQADTQNDTGSSLGGEFWNNMDLSKGSILTILKGILEANPNDRDALECLARTLSDNDDASRSLVVIKKLEQLEPKELEWKYLKAFTYDLSGKFQEARQVYEDILKVEPFSSKAIQGLMMALDELNEVDAMAELVDKKMTLARAQNNLIEARNIAMLVGQFYMMKGHMHEALEHYDEMLEEDTKDFRPYLCQGIIYSALGEKAKAEQKFKMYEKFCPKDYPEKKYLDALMRKAKQEGQKRFEEKQTEKYVRVPKDERKLSLRK